MKKHFEVPDDIKLMASNFCAECRDELSSEERSYGWDYRWYLLRGCIFVGLFSPDGEILEEFLFYGLTNLS